MQSINAIMKISKRKTILALFILLQLSGAVLAENKPKPKTPKINTNAATEVVLQFKSNGKLTSVPPERLLQHQKLSAKILLDENFWTSRINTTLSAWITVLENLNKFGEGEPSITYGLKDVDIFPISKEYATQLKAYIKKLPPTMLSDAQKAYYLQKVQMIDTQKAGDELASSQFAPMIATLIEPAITINYRFLDRNGLLIDENGEPQSTNQSKELKFTPQDTDIYSSIYLASAISLPEGCREVRYELRLAQNQNLQAIEWVKNKQFPEAYASVINNVSKALGETYMKSISEISSNIIKLQKDPNDASVDLHALESLIKSGNEMTQKIIDDVNVIDEQKKAWLSSWLWLSEGKFKLNPFDPKATLFAAEVAKVTPQNKAKAELFDNMVNKGALQLNSLDGLEGTLNEMAAIKAALSDEASTVNTDPKMIDRLLYNGLLKVGPSDTGAVYMRHLDAANNYLLMGSGQKKEITELDRLYIIAENKPVPVKLSIGFTSATIATDQSYLGVEIRDFSDIINRDSTKKIKVSELIKAGKTLIKNVNLLRSLSPLPSLPLLYERDDSPDLISQLLEHNYLIEAPATATYTVKTVTADAEKEVASGSYRINKLYRMRFKAGLIYSAFEKRDYTQNANTGRFELSDPQAGIDGTFGIQVYLGKRQDLRSSALAWRPYLYTGLSMRKITENFYLGTGLEPISGLAIGINAHLSKREALSGPAGQPTGIRDKWGVGVAGSILIDAGLFIKLFSFGSSNKALMGF